MRNYLMLLGCLVLVAAVAFFMRTGCSNIVEGLTNPHPAAGHLPAHSHAVPAHPSVPAHSHTAPAHPSVPAHPTPESTRVPAAPPGPVVTPAMKPMPPINMKVPTSTSTWHNSLTAPEQCTFATCGGVPVGELGNCRSCGDGDASNVENCPVGYRLCPPIPSHLGAGQCVTTGTKYSPENTCVVPSSTNDQYNPEHPYVQINGTTWTRCEYAAKAMSNPDDCKGNFAHSARTAHRGATASTPLGPKRWRNGSGFRIRRCKRFTHHPRQERPSRTLQLPPRRGHGQPR